MIIREFDSGVIKLRQVNIETFAREMKHSVFTLRTVTPPSGEYAQRSASTLSSGPPTTLPADDQWELKRCLECFLTRDLNGKALGSLLFESGSRTFAFRDSPAAVTQVCQLLAFIDGQVGSKGMWECPIMECENVGRILKRLKATRAAADEPVIWDPLFRELRTALEIACELRHVPPEAENR